MIFLKARLGIAPIVKWNDDEMRCEIKVQFELIVQARLKSASYCELIASKMKSTFGLSEVFDESLA